ncbi:MAG: exo-alpha-sialidase [Opitutus sp.]|nr:exo-alpha-sialidase [Opitutus sp.]
MKLNTMVAALALAIPVRAASMAGIVSVEKIWDGAPHCAFTDLTRHEGKWFCTFREGAGHVPVLVGDQQKDGAIRVLSSPDGRKWSSTALLTEPTMDLRDPHFSTTPDGRLMIVMGGSLYVGDRYFDRQSRVSFSKDGITWTPVQPILADGDWLWRVTWHQGRAYGVSKRVPGKNNPRLPKRGNLVTSTDGVHWNTITELAVPGIDEATVIFGEGGEMQILVRRESDNNHAWIGRSAPPYTQWRWNDCGQQVGGPNLVRIPGHGLWAGGRTYPARKTGLAEIVNGRYMPKLVFPSGGDNSYPGFVWHDGVLWMSYYSSHEARTAIYLAKVSFD